MKTNIHIPSKIIWIIFSKIFHCILLIQSNAGMTVCVCGLWYRSIIWNWKIDSSIKIVLLCLNPLPRKLSELCLVWLCKEVFNQTLLPWYVWFDYFVHHLSKWKLPWKLEGLCWSKCNEHQGVTSKSPKIYVEKMRNA